MTRGERVGGGEKGSKKELLQMRNRERSSSGAQPGDGKNEEEQCILGSRERQLKRKGLEREQENDTGSLCRTGHTHHADSLELLLACQQSCEEAEGLCTMSPSCQPP